MSTKFASRAVTPAGRPQREGKPFNVVELLRDHVEHTRNCKKRRRTRAQILLAGAIEIERVGYEALTVDLIAERAGVARGTFYLHFKDRSHIASLIMRIYFAFVRRRRPRGSKQLSTIDAIRRYNQYYIAVYSSNVKLLLGRESLWRERAEVRAHRDAVNTRWARTIKRDVVIRNKEEARGDEVLELSIRAAVAMVDELLREIFLHRTPSLSKFADDPDLLCEVLSDLWFKIIYLPTTHPLAEAWPFSFSVSKNH
ncbi:MAG: TetR/AcrR family transcriptional regulator [Ottowia sp.]|uniref:TetR/AcrR family transcriptional regulator n=1 Tax=Ottowia sp. TaxID=1898956 RepID=UPI003C70DF0C